MTTDRSEVVTKAIKSKSIARFDLAKVTSTGLFSMNKVLDQFCNSTSRTIYIKNHSGVIITVRPSALAQLSGSLSIVKRYSLDYNSAVVARNGLSNVEYDEDYFPGTGSSFEVLNKTSLDSHNNMCTCDYVVEDIIDFKDADEKDVYFNHSTGYLMSLDEEVMARAIHPFTRIVTKVHDDDGEYSTPTLKIDVVSNEETIGPRYAKVFGKVLEIKPTTDHSRISSIYIYYFDKDELIWDWSYGLDEKETFTGFFKTREEAECHGDIEITKLRLKLSETETSLVATEKQASIKQTELEQKSKDIILSREKAERDREAQIRDDYFTQRKLQLEAKTDAVSHVNKTNLEYLKIIPAVATFAVLMYAIVKGKN